jgi:hypothetical protein
VGAAAKAGTAANIPMETNMTTRLRRAADIDQLILDPS